MKIQLVSFKKHARYTSKLQVTRPNAMADFLSHSTADFVMFSEHALRTQDDLTIVQLFNSNTKIVALLELKEGKTLNGNRMYLLQGGEWSYIGNQVFSTSDEVDPSHVDALLETIEGKYERFGDKRQFEVAGKNFLILQCGENNILKGLSGTAEFRLKNHPSLEKRFNDILEKVNIVLNPVHERWGRFGSFLARLRKFSENGRYCFSCTQMQENMLEKAINNPTHNTTQVVMHNGELISPISSEVIDTGSEYFLAQTYEID